MIDATFSLTLRHPELVSGSIVRRTLEHADVAQLCGSVACEPMAPRLAEKWTLKQVQGDEDGSAG